MRPDYGILYHLRHGKEQRHDEQTITGDKTRLPNDKGGQVIILSPTDYNNHKETKLSQG